MSSAERALKRVSEFGNILMQGGLELAKAEADIEATNYKIKIADEIETFKTSLNTDPDYGSPLSDTPEGYMKKWEDYTNNIKKQVAAIRKPRVRNEVEGYLGSIIPGQQSVIADKQYAGWGAKMKADTNQQILQMKDKAPDSMAFITFASERLKTLMSMNLIDQGGYDTAMETYSQLAIEDEIFKEATSLYDEKGEAAALDYLVNAQLAVPIGDRSYSAGAGARKNAQTRLDIHIAKVEEEAEIDLTKTFYDNFAYYALGGAPREGEVPLTFQGMISEIKTSKVKDKGPWYQEAYTYMQRSTSGAEDMAVNEVVRAKILSNRRYKGETLTPEEIAKADSYDNGSVLKGLTGAKLELWSSDRESDLEYRNAADLRKKQEKARTASGKILDVTRKLAYGQALLEGETSITQQEAEKQIDALDIPADEKTRTKAVIGDHFQAKAQRELIDNQNDAEAALGASLYNMELKLLGREYDPIKIISETSLGGYEGKLAPGRLPLYQAQYTNIAEREKAKTQETTRNNTVAGFDIRLNYWDVPAPNGEIKLDPEEVKAAYKTGTITESDHRYYLAQISARKMAEQARIDAENKTTNIIAGLWSLSDARKNLRKQYNKETLPKGAAVLDKDFIGTLPVELQQSAIAALEEEVQFEAKRQELLAAASEDKKLSKKLGEFNKKLDEGTLTTTEVNAAFDNKEINESAQSHYLGGISSQAAQKKREDDYAAQQQAATDHFLLIRKAHQNLVKKNNGEKYEGDVLSEEWYKDKGFTTAEIEYATNMLDAENERKKQVDARKAKETADKALGEAKLKSQQRILEGGYYGKGNIDLNSRAQVKLDDGSSATIRSMSFEEDGQHILVPSISKTGEILSSDQAWAMYEETGEYLGKFASREEADAYAKELSNRQDKYYTGNFLTVDYVKEVLGADAPNSPWMDLALQLESEEKRIATQAAEKTWEDKISAAESISLKWANGEGTNAGGLTDELINSAPASVSGDKKTALANRISLYAGQHDQKETERQRTALGEAAANSYKVFEAQTQEEKEAITGPLLTRSAIWASNLPFNEKLSLDNMWKAMNNTDGESDAVKQQAQSMMGELEAAAEAIWQIKSGWRTSYTVTLKDANGKSQNFTFTAADGEKKFDMMLQAATPYLKADGKLADGMKLVEVFKKQPSDINDPYKTVWDVLDEMSKPSGKTPALIPADQLPAYRKWLKSQQENNPTPSVQTVQELTKALKEKPWTANAQQMFSLASMGSANDLDKVAEIISSGSAGLFMSRTADGQFMPMHPRADGLKVWKEQMPKVLESIDKTLAGKLKLGTNATGMYLGDGQYQIYTEDKALIQSIYGKNTKAKRVVFELGRVNEQAHIVRQTFSDMGNGTVGTQPTTEVFVPWTKTWVEAIKPIDGQKYTYTLPKDVQKKYTDANPGVGFSSLAMQ